MSSRHVGSALLSPPAEVGPALLEAAEDQWFERKSIRVRPETLAKALVALANAEGGTVIVGLNDGEVEGVDRSPSNVSALQQTAMDFTLPPVRAVTRRVACLRSDGEPDHLLVFEVEPSEVVHSTNRDEVFLRVGDESRRLSFHQRQELVYDKGQSSFDATVVSDLRSDDLDWPLVSNYAKAVGSTNPVRLLQARGLIDKDDRVSAAACLLFAEHPGRWFPAAHLRVLRYRGVSRGTGSRQQLDADEDIRVEGPVPRVLHESRELIRRLQPARQVLGKEGVFVREGLIPEDAWLEGVVNAVVHRSYSMGGDHVRVEIFNDRIEITSPGRFPGLVRLDNPLKVDRFARNPRVARVCADLKWSEELGEGIKRMYTEMRAAGLLDPLYQQTDRTVRLSLVTTSASATGTLPSGSREILEVIREAGGLSTGDVAAAVSLSRPTVLKRLNLLATVGLVDRVGKSPQDPRAYWRLRSE